MDIKGGNCQTIRKNCSETSPERLMTWKVGFVGEVKSVKAVWVVEVRETIQ
jgi:hypothetical protein